LNRFSYTNNNPLRYSDPTGHEDNDVVDQLQKSKRFSDSIMDLIRKLGESDAGSKLLTFLLQNTDITIQWASAVIFKGGTDQFAQKQNGPDAGAYAGGIVLHKGEILLNTNVFNMTELQGNRLLWHQTAQTLIDAAKNLGHELFHVLQGDCMIGCGTTSVSKPGYPRDQSEYNAYVVGAKIDSELNGYDYWDPRVQEKYKPEFQKFDPSTDVGASGTTPRDAALWKSLLVYPPKPQ
jgi:hypothetical protein